MFPSVYISIYIGSVCENIVSVVVMCTQLCSKEGKCQSRYKRRKRVAIQDLRKKGEEVIV